jgi:hypothetical protein
VVGYLITRTQGVRVVGEGTRGDARLKTRTVTTKTVGCVEDLGRAKFAGVLLLLPVTVFFPFDLVSVSRVLKIWP